MLPTEAVLQERVATRLAAGRPTGKLPAKLADSQPITNVDQTVAKAVTHELAEVNRRWRVHANVPIATDRRRLVKFVKRAIRKATSWYVEGLGRMQTDYNASATRLFNALVITVRAIGSALNAESSVRSAEVAALTAKVNVLEDEARVLRAETAHLSEELQNGLAARVDEVAAALESLDEWSPDWLLRHPAFFDYKAFQDRFRGSEETITSRQQAYVMEFADVPGPVLDLGCGRGEFLKLCLAQGLEAVGVDLDATEVGSLRSAGLDVQVADALEYLVAASDASFGAVTLFQVAEHLPIGRLIRIVQEAYRVLRPDGRIAIETVNPESLFVFTHSLYVDPTHMRPIHPLLLQFVVEANGFEEVQLSYRSPVPETERLHVDQSMEPDEVELLRLLNEQLYGPQEFVVLGRKAPLCH